MMRQLLKSLVYALKGYPVRFRAGDKHGTFRAYDATNEILFCRWKRAKRYKKGVKTGIDRVAQEYGLHSLSIERPGTFIDCGANIGELGIWADDLGFKYVPFEPEELEAICCDMNNFGGKNKTLRKALWNEDTTLSFYSKPDSADSSIFEMKNSKGIKEIDAVTLDSYEIVLDPTQDNILKLEAEGAEPEVLLGAEKTLDSIKYVVADCGYERGMNQDHTFIEVLNFLQKKDYRLVHCNFMKRVTAVFEKAT